MCQEYLVNPATETELTRTYGTENTHGAAMGLEDWFFEELILTYPTHFPQFHPTGELTEVLCPTILPTSRDRG